MLIHVWLYLRLRIIVLCLAATVWLPALSRLIGFLMVKIVLVLPAYGAVFVLDTRFGLTPAQAVLWVGLATVPLRFWAHRSIVFKVRDRSGLRFAGSLGLWFALFLLRYWFLVLLGEPPAYLYLPIMAAFGVGQAVIEYVVFDRWLFKKA